jgi:hypothetical protein
MALVEDVVDAMSLVSILYTMPGGMKIFQIVLRSK